MDSSHQRSSQEMAAGQRYRYRPNADSATTTKAMTVSHPGSSHDDNLNQVEKWWSTIIILGYTINIPNNGDQLLIFGFWDSHG